MNESEAAGSRAARPKKRERGLRRITRDPQRTRLQDEVQIGRLRLQYWDATIPAGDTARRELLFMIESALKEAESDLDRLDIDGGYANLYLAQELEFGVMTDDELDARALELRAEASTRAMPKWRSQVVTELLESASAAGVPSDRRRGLTGQAARVALGASAERNRRMTILRRHQTILLLIALVLLTTAAGITVGNTKNFDDLDNWWVAVVAVLLGGLGGVTSALQRSTRSGLNAAGDRFTSYVVSLSRPLMGAVAGFIAYIGQRVLIEQDGTAQVAAVLVASFAAGFAERLLPVNPEEPASTAPAPAPVTDEG